MLTPYIITLLAVLVALCYFLVVGLLNYSTTKSSESYFLYNRNLSCGEYGNSFAAASTSLATVLFFFVVLGLDYGLYILFSPLSFWFGIMFFNRIILPRLEQHGYLKLNSETSSKSLGTTLGNYIYSRYNSKIVKNFIVVITLLGIISILLIELYVGVDIFRIFIKEEYKEYALIVIALVTFIYTGFGGISAVIKTDKKQLWLMIFVAFTLIIWLLSKKPELNRADFLPAVLPIKEGPFILPWALFLNIFFVNFFLVPSLLRNWQITASSQNSNEVRKGLNIGLILTVFLSTLFVILGILFFHSFPETDKSLNGILVKLSESESWVSSFVFFPLFFVACLSALLSTVDSSLMPVLQSVFQDFKVAENKSGSLKYFIATFAILSFTIGLYFLVFKLLRFDLISWLFTLFSLVIIASPAIIFGIIGNQAILKQQAMKVVVITSTSCGYLIALIISQYGNELGVQGIIQLNSPIATGFTIIPISITYWILNRKFKKTLYG